ncbi:MAG: right-handed parallel beta-helix repeat-containing protein [Planctomycetota bacterium]|jgi:hypothetical protein
MQSKVNCIVNLGISVFIVVLIGTATTFGKVIYVDDSAIGTSDGTSWNDAYNYLQDALADANTASKPVEILVAQGVYTPDQGAGVTRGDRLVTFQLINEVSIRGGFAGVGATDPDVRYIEAYKTILSGDLAEDDADVIDPDEISGHPTRAENSYSVVSGSDTDETAMLDGVTITACSTCMSNWHGNPFVSNCTFTNASRGISNLSGRLTNCTFKGLWSQAIDHDDDTLLTLTDCLFIGNRMGIRGGFRGDLTLRDCTFVGDGTMESREAIDFRGDSHLKLYNCEFRNIGDGVRSRSEGEFIADNCSFIGNAGRSIDHWRGRMVISNCLFAGNRSSAIHSTDKYVIIEGCTFSDNSSDRGGSALDTWDGANVSNCIFWDNSSPAIEERHEEIVMNYCDIEGGWPGEGNIDVDPCFVSPGCWDLNGTLEDANDDFWVDGDYHLQSQAGHWDQDSQTWEQDDVTSPCIDAGDPNSPIGTEPFPNGGRVNMGAYGAGDKASKSYFGGPVCEVIIAGDINGDGIVDDEDLAILNSHWMMRADDFINKPPTVRLIEPQDGDRIAWRGPTTFRAEASDPDGQVDRVMFYMQYKRGDGTSTRGTGDSDGSDGWEVEFTWPEEAYFGEWTAWAEATDDEGLVAVSTEIKVTLYRP